MSIWGLVRPLNGAAGGGPGPATATITYADRGSSGFRVLRNVTTDARGYFLVRDAYRRGRRWNVTWQGMSGTPVASYESR